MRSMCKQRVIQMPEGEHENRPLWGSYMADELSRHLDKGSHFPGALEL